jgi:hypothetical protein
MSTGAAGAGLGYLPVVAEASLVVMGAGALGWAGSPLGTNMPAEPVLVGSDRPSVAPGAAGLGWAGLASLIKLAAEAAVGLGRPVAERVNSGNFVVMVEASLMAVGAVQYMFLPFLLFYSFIVPFSEFQRNPFIINPSKSHNNQYAF